MGKGVEEYKLSDMINLSTFVITSTPSSSDVKLHTDKINPG